MTDTPRFNRRAALGALGLGRVDASSAQLRRGRWWRIFRRRSLLVQQFILGRHRRLPWRRRAVNDALLLDIHRRAFNLFWDRGNTTHGLIPDRTPTASASSIAGVGFTLTAYVIGAMNAYVARAGAAARTVTTLRHFWTAPQGPAATGTAGYHGFFYHFLDIDTGLRNGDSELSSIDTSLFLMGALTAAQYFDGADATETRFAPWPRRFTSASTGPGCSSPTAPSATAGRRNRAS
ncbi:MAG: hypothetical protein WDN06_16525 [Asticcacaulis sp.]